MHYKVGIPIIYRDSDVFNYKLLVILFEFELHSSFFVFSINFWLQWVQILDRYLQFVT